MTNSIRAFIAIELPDEVKSALADVALLLRRSPSAKYVAWVNPHAMHLTLKFFGDVPPEKVPAITSVMDGIAQATQPFTLALGSVGTFPNKRNPRVFWVGLGGGLESLITLSHGLERQLTAAGFTPESRAFSPHLTLGRTRQGWIPSARVGLADVLTKTPVVPPHAFPVRSVSLFSSVLLPEGARHTRLREAHFPLPS